jgi:hypothetical protein
MVILKHKFRNNSTRAGGNLVVTVGDYDDSGNSTKIVITDSTGLTEIYGSLSIKTGDVSIETGGDNDISFVMDMYKVINNTNSDSVNVGHDFIQFTDNSESGSIRVIRPTTLSSGTSTLTLPDASGEIVVKVATPSTATSTGIAGQVSWDASYFYVCTATNTWVRTALATW